MAEFIFPGTKDGRPTRKSLSAAWGFDLPEPFVRLVQTIYDVTGPGRKLDLGFWYAIGGNTADCEAVFDGVPPEFFAICDTGGDGELYGYVIHAPELASDDYPIGSFCPPDNDGVCFIGNTTREAVENFLSWRYFDRDSDPMPESVEEVVRRLELRPSGVKSAAMIGLDSDGELIRCRPVTPEGWRHVMTSDGVGVLLPAEAFHPGPHCAPDHDDSPMWYLKAAHAAESEGFPGTALFYLKEGTWRHPPYVSCITPTELADRLVAAYLRVGRKRHAAIAAKRLGVPIP